MGKRLNHENASFKLDYDNHEPAGGNDYHPQSIQELQKEINECDLCRNLPGDELCMWHEERLVN